ncbi:MAG: radical SAM protein [Kiloniellales bacterium]|nr:radical SAM protein [Kiloniellales bacterium]
MAGFRRKKRKAFRLVMIKPSHYDDDGYVIQWLRSWIPSNSLAALYGLAVDCRARRVLGDDVDLELSALDETNARIKPKKIARQIRQRGGRGLVALVGVQSNQFPRAMDIARPLRAAGVQVCIGGFHVSGCLAMLPELPPELREAQELGISLFAGEAEEGRLAEVLRDADRGALKPVYNHLAAVPDLQDAALPFLPYARVRRTIGAQSSFDAGRGCPFQCSFCTIINVQGRKSRFRDADAVEEIVRENLAQGVNRFFITDDNLARNRNWEAIFDRLIELREGEGLPIGFLVQVDTLCHKIPNFIEKAGRAGIDRVFIGLENINPESLVGVSKRQNRITEYRAMLQAWKDVGARTYAGYILGFPGDNAETIVRDIEIIQRELPLDLVEFFNLTPLPGSADHRDLAAMGEWMEPDLNSYDLNHATMRHPRMSAAEWQRANRLAWETYYTPAHMETVMRRAAARDINLTWILADLLWFYGLIFLEKVHPLEGGILRRKYRRDRRPGLPVEKRLTFYRRYAVDFAAKYTQAAWVAWCLNRLRRQIERDPRRHDYSDLSLSSAADDEAVELDLFTSTKAARAEVSRLRRNTAGRRRPSRSDSQAQAKDRVPAKG